MICALQCAFRYGSTHDAAYCTVVAIIIIALGYRYSFILLQGKYGSVLIAKDGVFD